MGFTVHLKRGIISWRTKPLAVKTVEGSSCSLRKNRTITPREVSRIQSDVNRAATLERGRTRAVKDGAADVVLVDKVGITDGRSEGETW